MEGAGPGVMAKHTMSSTTLPFWKLCLLSLNGLVQTTSPFNMCPI